MLSPMTAPGELVVKHASGPVKEGSLYKHFVRRVTGAGWHQRFLQVFAEGIEVFKKPKVYGSPIHRGSIVFGPDIKVGEGLTAGPKIDEG